jgi:hypothetical protein
MNLPSLSLDTAVFLTAITASIGIAYNALEFYQARHEVLEQFYDWRIVRSRYYILIGRPVLGFLFDLACAPKVFVGAVLAHGVAALLFPIAFWFNHPIAAFLAVFVLSVHCLTNIRLLVGRDGADQMQNIIWASLFAFCLPINETARIVAIAFIPAQLILSYWTSGIAKAVSNVWRNGSAVYLITRMASYCSPGLAQICGKRRVSIIFSWLTIWFEVCSPFLLLGGRTGAVAFIVTGTLFHFGIAMTMGLTTFVFAFLASFPILYSFADHLGIIFTRLAAGG